MPDDAPARPTTNPWPRRLALCAIVWVVWTLAMGLVHWRFWIKGPTDSRALAATLNAAHLLGAPGWAPVVFTNGWSAARQGWSGFVAGAGSGVFWIGVLGAAECARRRLVRRAPVMGDALANPSRRAMLVNTGFAGVGLLATGAGAQATALDPWRLTVRRYSVPIADLPPALEGMRIAFLADPHLGIRVPRDFVRRAIELTDSLNADLVALGGDYFDLRTTGIEAEVEAYRRLVEPRDGRIGCVGVLGNHDWYGDAGRTRRAMQAIGVHMIDNDRVFIDARTRRITREQPPGLALCVAGLGDLMMDVVRVDRALTGVRDDTARIVLSHSPDTAEMPDLAFAQAPRVDLMLSGHTHGGQVRLPLLGALVVPSRYGQKYEGGLRRAPRFPIVISRGVGMSLLPVRLNVPPEVVEVTLTSA